MLSKKDVQLSLRRSLAGLQENPFLAKRVMRREDTEEKRRKKLPATAIVAFSIIALMATAMAAGMVIRGEPWGLINWITEAQTDRTNTADPVPAAQQVFIFGESPDSGISDSATAEAVSGVSPRWTSDTVEFSMATVSVREVVSDGYGIYLSVELKPADSDILLLNHSINPFRNTPEDIGREAEYSGQTIAEWAVNHGYREMIRVSLASPSVDAREHGRLVSSMSYDPWENNQGIVQVDRYQLERVRSTPQFNSYNNDRMVLEPDGTSLIMLSGAYIPSDFYEVSCMLLPWRVTADGKEDSIDRDIPSLDPEAANFDYEYVEEKVVSFTMPSPNLGDYDVVAEYEGEVSMKESPEDKAQVHVQFLRTEINDYCVVRTKDPNRVYDGISVFLDAEKTKQLQFGSMYVMSYQLVDREIVFIQSCVLPEEIPAQLYLRWDDYEMNQAETAVVDINSSFAYDTWNNRTTYFTYDISVDGTITIRAYVGDDIQVVIPDEIDGMPVTAIGSFAFSGCSNIEEIVIPETVTEIGVNAFDCCKALTSIIIPTHVTAIGDQAFRYCISLQSIEIPEGVTIIPDDLFAYCYSLEEIIIPDSVTIIGNNAFCYCESLANVKLPDGLTEIGGFAFGMCKELSSINIPKNTEIIGEGAFTGCDKLIVSVIRDTYADDYCRINNIRQTRLPDLP